MRNAVLMVAFALLGSIPSSPPAPRLLSFEQRVEAQRTIERVYYAHQIGASLPFEQAVPRETLEKKVRTYLKQSAALEALWGTRITAGMLQAELERILRTTRLPQRLAELFSALDDDSFLIQETFVRAVLADRLARSFFEADARFQDGSGRHEAWDTWWSRGHDGLDESGVEPVASGEPARTWLASRASSVAGGPASVQGGPASGGTGAVCGGDVWDNGSLDDLPDPRPRATAVWTGSVAIFWGGGDYEDRHYYDGRSYNTGGRYDPLTDTWSQVSTLNAPSQRFEHTAVWTGSEMIVWGGYGALSWWLDSRDDGARYDPVSDTWTWLPSEGAPERRGRHSAIWTGSGMIIWGGARVDLDVGDVLNSGARYSPATDAWTPITTINSPEARLDHSAVWTGSEMVVVGGRPFWGAPFNTGGRYDPVADSWTPTAIAPTGGDETAVWTGSEIILWGGLYTPLNSGKRYRPSTDTWSLTSTVGAPLTTDGRTAVWTGSEMIVYGGCLEAPCPAGRYNPATDTWSSSTTLNSPWRRNQAAVWTGSLMVVWGGYAQDAAWRPTNTGARYDPAADVWTPTSSGGAPSIRTDATSILWTGSQAIIWGRGGGRYDPLTDAWSPISTLGSPSGKGRAVWAGSRMVVLDDSLAGGRYDPVADTWAPISAAGAPEARSEYSMLWTGSEVVIWGGAYVIGCCWNQIRTGGRYDPKSDTWLPTSLGNAPVARWGHSVVWSGSEMILWGGRSFERGYLDDGSFYSPADDTWRPLQTSGAPTPRSGHRAFWTGDEMIVWGGGQGYSQEISGGRYDPRTDTWTPVSALGATGARGPAVWTGSEMLVWGNSYNPQLYDIVNEGGRYDPAADQWSPIPVQGAPAPRYGPVAAWTEDSLLVWGGSDGFTHFNSGGLYRPPAVPEPPRVTVTVTPPVLWPPNRRMVEIHADVRAQSACAGVNVVLESIVSDGADPVDIQDADIGTPDFDFRLRAELDRGETGRTYVITYRATDATGNTSTATASVRVRQGRVPVPIPSRWRR